MVTLAPLLNPVLEPLYIEENAHTRSMSGRIREVNQIKVMLRVLEIKLRGVRGVLAFEDAQWMDHAAWKLLLEAMPLFRGHIFTLIVSHEASST